MLLKFFYINNQLAQRVNLSRAMGRSTNLFPYKHTKDKTLELDILREKIIQVLQENYGEKCICELRKVELTYTVCVASKEVISKCCNLFSGAFSERKRQSKLFVNKGIHTYLGMEVPVNTGLTTPAIKNKFIIKIYDKGLQLGLDESFCRIEFVLLTRYIKQLFKERKSIEYVFTEEALTLLQKEIKICYRNDVLPAIKQQLNDTVRQLYNTMMELNSPSKAYLEMKEYIHCHSEVKRAVKKYANKKHRTDNARNAAVHRLTTKYELDDAVIHLLYEFYDSC